MSKAVGSRRKKAGPKPLGKITVTIRMFPKTKQALHKAARKARKQISEYIEELVLTHLQTQDSSTNESTGAADANHP
jgi:hypothetical protein